MPKSVCYSPRVMKSIIATMMLVAAPLATAGVEAISNMQEPQGKPATFAFGGEMNREFMLDGKPFQIRGAEMHPQNMPREHWVQRIRAAKAMGMNTIAFYVYWNGLETAPGKWNLTGMNDIAAFIDLCQKEGMWVLFRPGPFVCGEWDLGGLPSRLLKKRGAQLRTTKNPEFMREQTVYLDKMAEIAIPRLCKNGGPIIMVQIENEYGSYRTGHEEKAYMEWLKNYWEKKGAGPLYVSEGSTPQHLQYTPKGVAIGLDPMGTGPHAKDTSHAIDPNVPVFSSETYPGWLRHWREGNWTPTRGTLNTIRTFMEKGDSFCLYMAHGGTAFGLTTGANATPKSFQADLTSYDYGAPIGEHGNLTKEYFEYREIVQSKLPQGVKLPEPPATPPSMTIPEFTPVRTGYMVSGFTYKGSKNGKYKGVRVHENPPTFEEMNQHLGIASYCTSNIPAGPAAKLAFDGHDYVQVYLNGSYVGTVDRTLQQKEIQLPERKGDKNRLELLVDTFGHVNFSAEIEKDCKGIVSEVTLDGKPVTGWKFHGHPLTDNPRTNMTYTKNTGLKGAFFRAEINLDKAQDTFFDMVKWKKGYVWVNGHLLGRYWNVGPQERLYCPQSWLKVGKNVVLVLDTETTEPAPIRGCEERNLEVHKQTENKNNEW